MASLAADRVSNAADPDERTQRLFYGVVGGLLVALLWLRPIASSLWVDEYGTWWTVKDGLGQAIDRSWTYMGQSPLYYVFAWAIRHLGHQGWLLRLPSLVFAAASVYLLYRLVRRLVDVECARIAAIVFVAWPIVAFSAIDYRPYALATLASIATTLAFVRWLDRGNSWLGVLAVVLLVTAIYAHYLFGLVAIALVSYAIARRRDGSTSVRTRDLLLAAIGAVVAIAPLTVELARLWDRRGIVNLPNGVSIDWIVTLLAPAALIGAFLAGGGLAALDGGRLAATLRIRGADLVLVVAWVVGPLAVIVLGSLVSSLSLQARYSLVWAPATAILAALAIRAFEPAAARRIVVLVLAVLSLLALGSSLHLNDTRGAYAAIRARADACSVVALQSGYIESLQLDWYADPERTSYLGAPMSYEPVTGRPLVLPVDVSPVTDFSRGMIEGALPGADRLFFVTTSEAQAAWVGEVLHAHGWTATRIAGGLPLVVEYSPPQPVACAGSPSGGE